MSRPRLLDLFCGAGGAAMGYYRAGFDVVGVDIVKQPRYPFTFMQGDAIEAVQDWRSYDAVHASPPCQAYSRMRHLPWVKARVDDYWDSLPPTLEALQSVTIPYVVENVASAPLDGITLCGQMFGLGFSDGVPLYRHRRFLTSWMVLAPGHPKHHKAMLAGSMLGRRLDISAGRRPMDYAIAGKGRGAGTGPFWSSAMGIDWMTIKELGQAIPPAYTEWIADQLPV